MGTLSVNNINAYWNKKQVLSDVSLTISSGDFICLSGPNGSGKSTLMKILACIPDASLSVTTQSVPINYASSLENKSFPTQNTQSVPITKSTATEEYPFPTHTNIHPEENQSVTENYASSTENKSFPSQTTQSVPINITSPEKESNSSPQQNNSVPKTSASSKQIRRTSSIPEILHLNGESVSKIPRKTLAKHISFLPQSETSAWNYSVKDIILTGRFAHTNATGLYTKLDFMVTDYLIDLLNIQNLAEKQIYSLSGGEYQKVKLARCLAQEPDFLLLDEPVANLDFSYQNELLQTLKQISINGYSSFPDGENRHPGILISIHDINTAARYAEKLILLSKIDSSNHQEIKKGSPEQILIPESLFQIYGNRFGTFTHPEYKCPQVYLLP